LNIRRWRKFWKQTHGRAGRRFEFTIYDLRGLRAFGKYPETNEFPATDEQIADIVHLTKNPETTFDA
jgi:hypothetical protein